MIIEARHCLRSFTPFSNLNRNDIEFYLSAVIPSQLVFFFTPKQIDMGPNTEMDFFAARHWAGFTIL